MKINKRDACFPRGQRKGGSLCRILWVCAVWLLTWKEPLKRDIYFKKKTNKRDLVLSVESSRSTPLTVDIKRDLYLSKEPYKSDVYFPEGKRKKGSHCWICQVYAVDSWHNKSVYYWNNPTKETYTIHKGKEKAGVSVESCRCTPLTVDMGKSPLQKRYVLLKKRPTW